MKNINFLNKGGKKMRSKILWSVGVVVCVSLLLLVPITGCKQEGAETKSVSETTIAETTSAETTAAETEAASKESVATEKKFRVGYSCFGWEIPWMVFYQQYFNDIIAKDYPNYEITYHDAKYDFQAMADGLETFVNEGYDLIMHFALDNLPMIETYKKIQAAGIPLLLTMDEPAYEAYDYMTCFSGLSPADAGRQCADMLNEALGGKGTYACITPPKGSSSYNAYMTRFYNRLEDIGSNLTLVAEEDGNWDPKTAQEKAASILAKYPDIDGFYVTDDWMGGGIVNAAKEKGYNPGDFVIAGCGGSKIGIKDLADGWYIGLVDQGPLLCAIQDAYIMKMICEKLGPVPHFAMVRQEVITKENIDRFPGTW